MTSQAQSEDAENLNRRLQAAIAALERVTEIVQDTLALIEYERDTGAENG